MTTTTTIETTTAATTTPATSKAPKAPKAPRVKKEKPAPVNYPFVTKNQIRDVLSTDDEAVVQSLQLLGSKQTSDEQAAKVTKHKNRLGFMASQAKKGTLLAEASLVRGLTSEEMTAARGLVLRYTTQLARHMRLEAIAANPELAEVATKFSAG